MEMKVERMGMVKDCMDMEILGEIKLLSNLISCSLGEFDLFDSVVCSNYWLTLL